VKLIKVVLDLGYWDGDGHMRVPFSILLLADSPQEALDKATALMNGQDSLFTNDLKDADLINDNNYAAEFSVPEGYVAVVKLEKLNSKEARFSATCR
jgi:hypothetical protein